MDFELPTTKEELKTVLAELFDYYHHYKGEYEGQPLEVLELDKLTFTEKSESAWRTELSALLDKREAAETKSPRRHAPSGDFPFAGAAIQI